MAEGNGVSGKEVRVMLDGKLKFNRNVAGWLKTDLEECLTAGFVRTHKEDDPHEEYYTIEGKVGGGDKLLAKIGRVVPALKCQSNNINKYILQYME